MPVEMPWHGCAFPLPELQPIAQGRRLAVVGDGADPMGWSAGYPVVRAGLDHGHDATAGRARRAGEWPQHACGGDEHRVWTAPDGGTQLVDDREVIVGRTRGADDDGESAVGTAARGSQRGSVSASRGRRGGVFEIDRGETHAGEQVLLGLVVWWRGATTALRLLGHYRAVTNSPSARRATARRGPFGGPVPATARICAGVRAAARRPRRGCATAPRSRRGAGAPVRVGRPPVAHPCSTVSG